MLELRTGECKGCNSICCSFCSVMFPEIKDYYNELEKQKKLDDYWDKKHKQEFLKTVKHKSKLKGR